jgi:hypothetical protein
MKLSKFKMDIRKVEEGTWVPAGDGLELLIARLGNEKYKKFLRSRGRHIAVQVRTGNIDTPAMTDLQRQAVAHTVLLGWKNLQDDAGQDITFSPGKALELFSSHSDFFDMVLEFANDASLFREEMQEDSKGNS